MPWHTRSERRQFDELDDVIIVVVVQARAIVIGGVVRRQMLVDGSGDRMARQRRSNVPVSGGEERTAEQRHRCHDGENAPAEDDNFHAAIMSFRCRRVKL